MSHELHTLEAWAGALLAKLQPAQRRAINHKVAIDLRRSQAQRIKAQQGPDGAAYPLRKRRKELRGKKGRIKRQRAAMFERIRTTKYLKVAATDSYSEVGFIKKVTRIVRVHHFGQPDKVSKKGVTYTYPERPLLGISKIDIALIREAFLRNIK